MTSARLMFSYKSVKVTVIKNVAKIKQNQI